MSQKKKTSGNPFPISHHQASPVMEVDASTSRVVQFINKTREGHVPLSVLLDPPLNFPSIEHIKSFILRNQDNFTTSNSKGPLSASDIVWVKTSLKLCDSHCRKGLTCDGACNCLHLCRNFLLRGGRFCPFSNKKNRPCMFGHNFRDKHNRNLLQAHNLDLLNEEELRVLFRRRTCRSMATMPQVCLYYNGRRGKRCNNKNCKSLHYCIDYLQSMCIGPCNRSHSMDSSQNRMVLELFAIDKSWTEEALRKDLQQVMEHRRVSDNSSHYSGSQSDSDDDEEDTSDVSEDRDIFDRVIPTYERLRISEIPHNGDTGSKGPCCAECRENKALVQDLMARVASLENDLREMKVILVSPLSELSGIPGLTSVPQQEVRRYIRDLGPAALKCSPTNVINLEHFWNSAFETVSNLIKCARCYICMQR